MSTQGASTSSPSSSSTARWTYDVFLSFRGEDTRKGFTDHLYNALKNKSIRTFRDAENLERGKFISQELVQAIEESRFAIVIFSINYAFSTWCLDELVHIVRCRKEKGLEVLPIFYHVNPSDVRKQWGTFGKAFDEYKERFKESIEKVEIWKSTLTEVTNLSGWDLQDRHESEFIQEIVEEMIKKLNSKFLISNENLVGIESIVAELIPSYLDFGNNVCMIGICGMGGIGKTTLARVVYDMHSDKFEASSFIADVREKSEKGGLVELQKKILEDLGVTETNISDVHQGVRIIKNWLFRKKVLLVLDDVNHVQQLEKLAGERHWFGLGSRIIISTRDKNVLVAHGVLKIYKPNGLNNDDALKLFYSKAFKNEQPREDYMPLSQEVVNYANGLPLALVTLGSFLAGKTRDEWQSASNYFKKNPPKEIFDILKISFDGLEDVWKEVFLDIACFFTSWGKEDVIHILENCGVDAIIGIRVLMDKSLLTLKYDYYCERLGMHDLLIEMGQKIVRQQSHGELGKQSRLWLLDDLFHVLENNMTTNAIQAIVINPWQAILQKINNGEAAFSFEEFPEVFSKMSNLRWLIMDELHIPIALNRVPNSLRHLSWKHCPLKCLPSSFQPKKLVELNLKNSKCEYLWEGAKCLENLKSIYLDSSSNLIRTPDFSGAPRLEVLNLVYCTNLVGLHPSIGQLSKLKSLDLIGCKSLTNLPSLSAKMESLTSIDLSNCSKIKKIPEFKGTMKSLSQLILRWTAIEELPPSSIECLTVLEILDLIGCKDLKCLPSNIDSLRSLKFLRLYGCSKLANLPENLWKMKCLERLDLEGMSQLEEIVFNRIGCLSAKMESLTSINLCRCSKIKKIPELKGTMKSLSQLILGGTAIEELPPSSIECLTVLEILGLSGCEDLKCLPSNIDSLRSLKFLDLSCCSKLANLPENLWKMKCLERLDLVGMPQLEEIVFNRIGCLSSLKYLSLCCHKFVTLPAIFSQLSKLEVLDLCRCWKLILLLEIPSTTRYINMESCFPPSFSPPSLCWYDENRGEMACETWTRYPDVLFCQKIGYETATKRKEDGSKTEYQIIFPGNSIPSWLSHQTCGNSIWVELSPNWCNSRWMGFTLCALINSSVDSRFRARVKAIGDMPHSQYQYVSKFHFERCEPNHVWLLYLSRDDWFSTVGNGECRQIEVLFEYDNHVTPNPVKECGVILVYKQDMEWMEGFNQKNAQFIKKKHDHIKKKKKKEKE